MFSSSCATYGIPERVPITEDHPQNPISPYGFTKLVIEHALADYSHAYGLGYAALRYFNASGAAADGTIGEDHDPETHLIPLVLQVALGQREYGRNFRHRLSDARRHVHPRLHPRRRSGDGPRRRAGKAEAGHAAEAEPRHGPRRERAGSHRPVPRGHGPADHRRAKSAAAKAIRRRSSPTPRPPNASSAGKRATRCARSSKAPGSGTASIRAGTATEQRCAALLALPLQNPRIARALLKSRSFCLQLGERLACCESLGQVVNFVGIGFQIVQLELRPLHVGL